MTTMPELNAEALQAELAEVTRAVVAIEALAPNKISVSVRWAETLGDHCFGQNTILREAHMVLAALEERGWKHATFGGRKDMGHGGGGTHFACELE